MSTAQRIKKAVNVSIPANLLQAARKIEINLSAARDVAVEQQLRQLRQLRQRAWLEQNGDAIRAYNRDVDEHGTITVAARLLGGQRKCGHRTRDRRFPSPPAAVRLIARARSGGAVQLTGAGKSESS
jgi:antitoxin CcdA